MAKPPPDADVCTSVNAMCATPEGLRECKTVGALPVDTTGTGGCIGPTPHCGALHPAGGAVPPAELAAAPSNMDITLANAVVDGGNGAISGTGTTVTRPMGTGVKAGIDYQVLDGVAV